jgi:hypothetical protein
MGQIRLPIGRAVHEAARRVGWIDRLVAIAFHYGLPLTELCSECRAGIRQGFEEIGNGGGTLVRLVGLVLAHLVQEELMNPRIGGEFRVERGSEEMTRADQRGKAIARGQGLDAGTG